MNYKIHTSIKFFETEKKTTQSLFVGGGQRRMRSNISTVYLKVIFHLYQIIFHIIYIIPWHYQPSPLSTNFPVMQTSRLRCHRGRCSFCPLRPCLRSCFVYVLFECGKASLKKKKQFVCTGDLKITETECLMHFFYCCWENPRTRNSFEPFGWFFFFYCTVVITVKPVCKVIPGLFEFHLFSIFHKLDNIASQHEPRQLLCTKPSTVRQRCLGEKKREKIFWTTISTALLLRPCSPHEPLHVRAVGPLERLGNEDIKGGGVDCCVEQ